MCLWRETPSASLLIQQATAVPLSYQKTLMEEAVEGNKKLSRISSGDTIEIDLCSTTGRRDNSVVFCSRSHHHHLQSFRDSSRITTQCPPHTHSQISYIYI